MPPIHNIFVTTQCTFQGTNLDLYKNGRETLDIGAIPTYDMSIEAVVTKLMWILGKTDQLQMIRRMMLHNYAGELNFGVSNKYGILSA
jgi:L-asparaginase/Glu-tRNA(Gln) amidotransferase subunit D